MLNSKLECVPILPLLNAANVAALLGITTKTVHKLARQGKLGFVQVTSRDRRFTHEQLNHYIESCSFLASVDRRDLTPVQSCGRKGGAKSSRVFNRADLLKEIRSWQ
nr:helix-turn-helix domain-containing protein [Desulfomonile tiedjei]